MTELKKEEIQKKIESPSKRERISFAVKHQNRLKFHTEARLDSSDAANDFLKFVEGLIPEDKFHVFLSLFRYPVYTTKIVKKIYEELERVYDGRNSAVIYQFEDKELEDDWNAYRRDVLHEPEIWHTKGWEVLQTAINSILVVDLPAQQTTDKPEPYFYFLSISDVIDYEMDGDKLVWLIFKQGENIAVFDEVSWKLYACKDNKLGEELVNTPHNLGYCPASFFWTTPLEKDKRDLKESPLSKELSNLDWLLYYATAKRNLDLYAAYPIYSTYRAECNYREVGTEIHCEKGFLKDNSGNWVLRNGEVAKCPICGGHKLCGAGTVIEVPIPINGAPDLSNPVQITTIDRTSLDYNTDEVNRLKKEIYESVTGKGGEMQNQSINELQVTASFEEKKNVLLSLKKNFEAAQKFVDETICRLRYGDNFISCSINWGTEFYLYSVEDLQKLYTEAKNNGASQARLEQISDLIIATETKNNPLLRERMNILKQIEPYRHLTLSEITQMAEYLDKDLIVVKLNFVSFVERFERENVNITEFGLNLTFEERIKKITQRLIDYGKERRNAGNTDAGSEN